MKNSISSLKKIASITGLFLGAFAISVAAATWTPPGEAPPGGNIDAPINAGASVQGKIGKLGLGAATPRAGTQVLDVLGSALIDNVVTNSVTVVNELKLPTDAAQGKVLTSDANGAATWQPAGAGGNVTFSPKITATGSGNSIIGPSSSYSACFLTKSGISASGNTNGSCSVYDNGTNWVIDATAGANDSSSCVAQCMRTNTPIVASCSASPSTVVIDQAVTWNSVVSGGNGTYTYLWTVPSSINGTVTNSTHSVRHSHGGFGGSTDGYHTTGPKTASLQVSSPGSPTVTVNCTPTS